MSSHAAFNFRKSSHSGSQGECVEVADNLPGVVAVRDSKDAQGPALLFSPDEWKAFITEMKHGGLAGI